MLKKLLKTIRYIQTMLRQMMMVRAANWLVFKIRFYWYVCIVKRLHTYSNEQDVLVPGYSLTMLKRGKTSDRPLHLIRPLSVLASKNARILSIGCRFETELLYLVGYGFEPRNIRGCDMISYSPWVDCGNMHDLPYPDNSWDALILGWVMTYSDNPRKAASEILRVAKNGALVAIGVSYYPPHMMTEDHLAQGELKLRDQRIQTVDGYLALFEGNIDTVHFRHDADPQREGVCSLIIKLKK